MQAYETIISELRAYNPNLLEKPRVLVLNKIDLLQPEHIDELKYSLLTKNHTWCLQARPQAKALIN